MFPFNDSHERLCRSQDGYLGGVCEGLGRRFGFPPLWLRVGWTVAAVFFGTGVLLYGLLWWLMPREDQLPDEPAVWKSQAGGQSHPALLRTQVDRKLFGVCGGLARRYGIDPTLVRLAALSLVTLSVGAVLVAYLVAAVLIPGQQDAERPPAHPVTF